MLPYYTFIVIGLALLWPWNCFLSASAYYDERFAHSPNLTKIYPSTMMSVSSLTSAAYSFYLSQKQAGVNYNYRLNLGLILTIVVFVVMAVSCVTDVFIRMPDTLFFGVLMSMVLLSAIATGLAQNGTMAVANVMGGIYPKAVMVGQAVAGVLPACVLIVSVLAAGTKSARVPEYVDKNLGVFAYYITASLVSVLAIIMYYFVQKNETKIHDFATEEQNLMAEDELDQGVHLNEPKPTHVPFALLWGKLSYIVSTIFLTFCVSLVFPVFASRVESTHYGSTSPIFQKKIYIPIAFLVWNAGDLLGRLLCDFSERRVNIFIRNPKILLWCSIARFLYIPLFLTCNLHPEQDREPLFASDLWYMFLQLTFGLTNGQLSTSAFMIVAEHCDGDNEKEAAGGFTAVFLTLGLAIGSLASYFLSMSI